MFIQYKTAGCKIQVRELLRKRLDLKDRKRYHLKKIKYHEDKIDEIEKVELVEVEKKLQWYLDKAKN